MTNFSNFFKIFAIFFMFWIFFLQQRPWDVLQVFIISCCIDLRVNGMLINTFCDSCFSNFWIKFKIFKILSLWNYVRFLFRWKLFFSFSFTFYLSRSHTLSLCPSLSLSLYWCRTSAAVMWGKVIISDPH